MKILILSLILFLPIFAVLVMSPVSLNLSPSSVWWNDSVIVSGIATYPNGTTIPDGLVNVTVGNVRCNNQTNSTGFYSCRFNAPQEIKKYNLTVNVTNSTGSSFLNSTTLDVKISYGPTPIGIGDRVVYERPMLLQDLSGAIRLVLARVTVWRG